MTVDCVTTLWKQRNTAEQLKTQCHIPTMGLIYEAHGLTSVIMRKCSLFLNFEYIKTLI